MTPSGSATRRATAGDGSPVLSVEMKGYSLFAIPYSPTHAITSERRGGALRVMVNPPVQGDVELLLPFRRGVLGGTVLTQSEPGQDGFALLFLAPPPTEDRPGLASGPDASWSMSPAR